MKGLSKNNKSQNSCLIASHNLLFRLTLLGLTKTGITSSGASAVADLLELKPSVTAFKAAYNNLGESAGERIAKALFKTNKVILLDLASSEIHKKGIFNGLFIVALISC